jgi:TolB-like protein/DNA-binding winged helix-turn-helix (wHTH) protein/Flp pilus assembly protein TadD
MSASHGVIRFRDLELDVAAYELRRNGRRIRLERHPMDLLILLVERRGELVPRADIIERLWGKDVFVDVETGVHTAMRKLRLALRDTAENPTFVETVPGRGYRFVAPVELLEKRAESVSPPSAPPVEPIAAEPAVTPPADGRRLAPLLFALALVTVIVLGVAALWDRLGPAAPSQRITLAVLPFENIGRDPERQYLADGLTEETSASLAQIDPEHLSVKGRTLRYKGTTKSAAEIGRELSVDYLLEGAMQSEGGQLRLTAKLIRVQDQEYVWTKSYEQAPSSFLGLQRELSAAIAEQIRLRLSPERLDAVTRRQSRNPDAYDLYLRGRNFANQRTPPTTRRAIEYYVRATEIDPSYALAWAGLSDAYGSSPINGDARPLDVAARTRDAAEQAVRADPGLSEAQFALGYVRWHFDWDWRAAEAAFRTAIALAPERAWPHCALGHILSQVGRHDEALPEMRRARELDPLDPMMHAMSSQVALQAGDSPAALEHARQAINLDPEFWIGHVMKGQALIQLRQTDPAVEALTMAARFSNSNSKAMSMRGYLLATTGRESEAREVLGALEAASRTRYVPPYALALVTAGLGDKEATYAWLERALEARDVHLMFLTADPKWNAFRADPRFQAFLARCDFMRAARP